MEPQKLSAVQLEAPPLPAKNPSGLVTTPTVLHVYPVPAQITVCREAPIHPGVRYGVIIGRAAVLLALLTFLVLMILTFAHVI